MNKSMLKGMVLVVISLAPTSIMAQSGEMKDMNTFERPIAMADNVWLEELTMPEVRDCLLYTSPSPRD